MKENWSDTIVIQLIFRDQQKPSLTHDTVLLISFKTKKINKTLENNICFYALY